MVHDVDVTVERPDLPRIVAKASEAVVDLPGDVAYARRPLAFKGRAESLFFDLRRAKATTGAVLSAGTTALRLRRGSGDELEGDFDLPAGELLGVPIDCEDLVQMAPQSNRAMSACDRFIPVAPLPYRERAVLRQLSSSPGL